MAKGKAIGGKIVLEGASQYNSDLRSIRTNLKEVQSEMKLLNTTSKSSQNSAETLRQKSALLGKAYDEAGKKVQTYAKFIESAQKAHDNAGKNIETLTHKLEEEKAKLADVEAEQGKSSQAYKEQEAAVKAVEQELDSMNAAYTKTGEKIQYYTTEQNKAKTEQAQYSNELQETNKYLEEAEKSVDGTAKSIDEYGNEVKEASAETSTFGDVLKANLTSEAIIAGVKKLAEGIKTIAEGAIESGMNFEAGMSKVSAISGATGADLDKLTEKAKEMGAKTMFSATESAEAFSYMAMAGWKTGDMLSGIEPIMNLAAASGEQLATVSDIVTDDLTAFGMSANEAGHFADVLAAASSNANTNVSMMGETFKYAAPVAGAMGYSLEDVALASGLMANASIKASDAGTALRSIMTRMAKPTKESAIAMDDLGLSLTNTDGTMKTFGEVLQDIRSGFAGMTEAEKTSEAAMLAGKTAMSGLLAIVNASDEDFNKLASAIDNSTGAAEQMATVMQDNLKGDITILQSALEGLGIAVYNTFSDDLRESVQSTTDAVGRFQKEVTGGNLGASLSKFGKALAEFTQSALSLGEKALPIVVDGLSWLLENADTIAAGVTGIVVANTSMSVISGAVSAASAAWGVYNAMVVEGAAAQEALNLAMDTNPIIALASAVLGLVAAVGVCIAMNGDALKTEDELTKKRNEELEATRALNEEYRNGADATQDSIAGMQAEADHAKELVDQLKELEPQLSTSNAARAEAVDIINQLNSVYPSLNLAIDEQTGALNMSTDAIKENIDALNNQAKAAAAQERLTEAYKEQFELQAHSQVLTKELAANQEEMAAKQEVLNKHKSEYVKFLTDEEKAILDVSDKTGELSEELEETNENYERSKEEIKELNNILEENGQTFQVNAETVGESVEQVEESLAQLPEYYEELIGGAQEAAQNFSMAFDQMNVDTQTSLSEIQANLEANSKAMTEYASNLEKAISDARYGVEPNYTGLVDTIASAGTDGARAMQELVDAAESEDGRLEEIMADFGKSEEAKANLDLTFEEMKTVVTERLNETTDAVTEGEENILTSQEEGQNQQKESLETHMDDMVTATGEGIQEQASTVESEAPAVVTAFTDMATDSYEAVEKELSGPKFYKIGSTAMKQLAEGIRSGSSAVASAIKECVQKAVDSADLSGLKSKIDRALGASMAK